MIRRWLNRLRPRCHAAGPWRLADCGRCIIPRGHDGEWHGDGTGYIWNGSHWRWQGPVVDLAEEYRDLPDRQLHGFEEYAK